MPEIVFKGKEYVYNHHLTVPYRPLIPHQDKGIGPADLASNLVIHGDNLHALKALLPRYAGKVDLVFIDPPYNTGNEGWCYNDNVNSPIMKEWLSTNPVDGEDMLRHDKWLCMMWPRLVLLRELLSDEGVIFISIDDNEIHNLRELMNEVFGTDNFIATFVWRRRTSSSMAENLVSTDHEYVVAYQKGGMTGFAGVEKNYSSYSNPDNDVNGDWTLGDLTVGMTKDQRPNQFYDLVDPKTNKTYLPNPNRVWAFIPESMTREIAAGRIVFPENPNARPMVKRYRKNLQSEVNPISTWIRPFTDISAEGDSKAIYSGMTSEGGKLLQEMFGEVVFTYSKPVSLIQSLIEQVSPKDGIILDSFAGSGTTAHAVLKANVKDGGTRKFILVEGEGYADKLTAERVRRAIKGYAWLGTQREELLREKITYTQFKKADEWLKKVEAIKAKEGFAEAPSPQGDLLAQMNASEGDRASPSQELKQKIKKRFDKINVELKDGVLLVEGEKKISQMVDGLGGEFTYCTLGEPLDIEKLLSGESLPSFDALGAWLFHTATGGTLLPAPKNAPQFYLGEAEDAHVWLVYEPNLNFLKSPEAALTLSRAKEINTWGKAKADGKKHLIFAPAKYMSNKQLLEYGVDYAPLPFALYREG
jgi:adenine-specific DNA-methyltransferase